MNAKKLSNFLILLALILAALPSVTTAAHPRFQANGDRGPNAETLATSSPAGGPSAVSSAPANPDAVLWDQPRDNALLSGGISDLFVVNPPAGIYSADDFENAVPWQLDTIFVDGFIGAGNLLNAYSLNWAIYPDAGGTPPGYPGDGSGTELWSFSCLPTDPWVTIGSAGYGDVTLDVVMALGAPVSLPAGHWWLVFYPEFDDINVNIWYWFFAETANLNSAHVIDPTDYFGMGWTWWFPWNGYIPDYYDLAFRLEGTTGQSGWLEGYVRDSETGDVDPTCTDATVQIEPVGLNVPVDPATGYYGPVALAPGDYTATASAPGYSVESAPVVIAAGETTPQDFNLWRPVITVDPIDFISITAVISQETVYPLTIYNSGHEPLDFEIVEVPLGMGVASAMRSFQQPPAAVGIDPLIYEQLTESPDGQVGFFVAFRDTADLTPAYALSWSDRGHFVLAALQAAADAAQRNVRAWLDERGIEYTSFWIDNTLFLHADEATLNALATFPEVAGFKGNQIYQIMPIDAPGGQQGAPLAPAYPWNITFPLADQVHLNLGITGQGVVIGGMDTGAEYDHMGLVNNYRGNLGGGSFDHTYSWYDPDNECGGGNPCDTHGHGTATMGIMAGDDDPALPDGAWIGMAPDAQWIHCVGCPGGSCPSNVTTACAQWFLAPGGDPDMRPQVVNHSWGIWTPNDCNGNAFQAELMAYRAADIVPAFAAGNVGDYVVPPHCFASTSPANNTDPNGNPIAFSSGAHGSSGVIDYYSSGGPSACNNDNLFPDVAAPGLGSCTTGLGNTYNCSFSGTSSASPHTAGCVALVRSANPALTVDQVQQVIRDAANDVDDGCGQPGESPDWNNIYGEGHLDCYEAVESVLMADLPWVWEDPVSGIIPGPGETTVDVTFHCTETRDYLGTLRIMHNDPCAEPIEVPIELHCQEPQQTQWGKWINGVEWYPGIEFTLQTSDTLEVTEIVTTLQDFVLVEFWNPDELDLLGVQPSVGDVIITPGNPTMLEWIVPPGEPMVATLTKWFHVQPCNWTETVLWEELWIAGVEIDQRPVTIFKLPPQLWIDSQYEPEVWAGGPADFALFYGNTGGYETDVMVRNDFPPEAPFDSAMPPPDRWDPDGSWAEWDVGDLPMDGSGAISVTVAIDPSVPPSTTIDIWDYIFDHVGVEQDSTLITFHAQPPGWLKWINGVEWYPGIEFTLQTSDTLEVTEIVTTLQDFVLVEFWNPDELDLLGVQPSVGDVIITPGNPTMLEWIVPPGEPMVATLTKWFHVEPCNWTETTLWEELWSAGVEIDQRPVTIFKLEPQLWIDSQYEPEVWAGGPADFTLFYGNTGGYETDVMVRNDFPPEAPFATADPPPDRWAGDGSWAEWDVGDLPMDGSGTISVTVAIDPSVPPSTTIDIWDYIFDHVGVEQDSTLITLHAQPPGWLKWINGVEWHPGIEFTLQTSDTLEVVDVITSLQDFNLVEFWNPDELDLAGYQVDPPGVGVIITDTPGMLEWIVPPGEPMMATLTKWFHVEPCNWTETTLWEELWVGDMEIDQRPVTVFKILPELWIDSQYEQEVEAGKPADFTLFYGNDGGYETDIMVRNDFPPEAPFVTADPPPDDVDENGLWAIWEIGGLGMDEGGEIDVTVAISDALEPCTWITITDWIYDHTGEIADVVTITLHVTETCIPLVDITIEGPIDGYPGVYTFTTSYEPVTATPPIAYWWDNGDITSDTVRFLDVGVYTLTVTATNCIDVLVTGTHTIFIGEPVSRVYLPIVLKNH